MSPCSDGWLSLVTTREWLTWCECLFVVVGGLKVFGCQLAVCGTEVSRLAGNSLCLCCANQGMLFRPTLTHL